MPFEKGNKLSEKWDLQSTIEFCEDVYMYVKNNEKCRSLTRALTELDGYDDLLCYLENKHKSEYDFKPIKLSKDIIKARIIEQSMDGDANAMISKFVLTNNHGMREKIETDNKTELSGKVETKTTISFTKGSNK